MPNPEGGSKHWLLSKQGFVLAGFLAVAGYFLWSEHEAHVKLAIPYFPYLLLLLCPLMHLFMHRGHDGPHHRGKDHAPNSHKPGDGERP
ncbi:MAG: DUF2933 domain-containing protein [Pseudomonadota bacterium]